MRLPLFGLLAAVAMARPRPYHRHRAGQVDPLRAIGFERNLQASSDRDRRLQFSEIRMADDQPQLGYFNALKRQIDDLVSEASRIREEITDSMRRAQEHPFWPDRRRERRPFSPERRATC